MGVIEILNAYGHQNIQSTHKTTFEITSDSVLTKRGDCIIAVRSTKGAVDLSPSFKEAARIDNARIIIRIKSNGVEEMIKAQGSSQLLFTHPTDIVVRKSGYICGRTIAIRADKAAGDLQKKLVNKLIDPYQKIYITLTIT